MMLTSTEEIELHALLRQQGKLTQDDCWDVIEIFEKFLLARPEQEPVAWRKDHDGHGYSFRIYDNGGEPLYTQQKREPLSDKVINILKDRCIRESHKTLEDNIVVFVRAIEKAHGIC